MFFFFALFLLIPKQQLWLAIDRHILTCSQQHESESYCHIWQGYKPGLNHTGEQNQNIFKFSWFEHLAHMAAHINMSRTPVWYQEMWPVQTQRGNEEEIG